MPFAEWFIEKAEDWKKNGSPEHEHVWDRWYDHPGVPPEGYGCLTCGEWVERP